MQSDYLNNNNIAAIFFARETVRNIAGMSDISRLIQTARLAGIAPIIIVAEDKDRLENLQPLNVEKDIQVVAVGTDDEQQVLRSISLEMERVVIAHTEVAIDPQYFVRMVEIDFTPDCDVLLAVTDGHRPDHPVTDMVTLSGNCVIAVGDGPDYFTGVALAPARVAASMSGGLLNAAHALQSIVIDAVAAGRARCMPLGFGHASVIMSAEDVKKVEYTLVRAVAKNSDGLVSRNINRYFSAAITRQLLSLPVSPNTLSFISLGIGLTAGAVMAVGSSEAFVLGALLYQLNSAFDGCDGELARLRFQTSEFGGWLDTTLDHVGNTAFAAGIAFGIYRIEPNLVHFLAGWFIVIGVATLPWLVYRRTNIGRSNSNINGYGKSLVEHLPEASKLGRIARLVTEVARRDSYALLFLVFACLGLSSWIYWGLVIGVAAHIPTLLLPVPSVEEPTSGTPGS